MGRKSIVRERKPLTEKTKLWVRELIPLLQDRTLHNLTLDELAALMGKSKSTIYSYFSTKEEIYQTMVELILEDLQFVTSPEAIEGEDIEQAYRTILLTISQGVAGLSISFLEQIQSQFPEVWLLIDEFTTRLLANLERIYAKGMEAGVFKTFNIPLLMALDNHFVMSIMTNTVQFKNLGISFDDLVTDYLELRLSALKSDVEGIRPA